MNKLTVLVHTPSGVGEATITRETVLNSKWLSNEQKKSLLAKMGYESKPVEYEYEVYYKVAEGKKVKVVDTEVYYSPKADKYLAIENEQDYGYFDTYNTKTTVLKDNTKFLLW